MNAIADPVARRRRHADYYLRRISPIVAVVSIAYAMVNAVGSDRRLDDPRMLVTYAAILLVVAAIIAVRRIDPLVVMECFAVATSAIVIALVVLDPAPESSSFLLLIPVLLYAYFGSPKRTLLLSAMLALAVVVMRHVDPSWELPDLIPVTCYLLLFAGALLAFASSQTRATERALEHEVRLRDERVRGLVEVEQVRERLIATVSHELRTPLTSTLGFIDTLLREDVSIDEDVRHQLLVAAHEGGERLLALVEDLLSLDSTTPDDVRRHAERVDVLGVVTGAVAGIDPGDDRSIHLHVPSEVEVLVDRRRMQQVLTNLVRNAVHHGRGDIDVTVRPGRSAVEIDVVDDGDGIDPAHESELFRPFARFSDRSDSTGLGLAICKTIVDAHGGSLDYERTGDGHTCFRVRIPQQQQR